MGMFCRLSDHGDLLRIFKRQQTIVLEQHHAFGGNLLCQFVVRIYVESSLFRRFFGFEDNP